MRLRTGGIVAVLASVYLTSTGHHYAINHVTCENIWVIDVGAIINHNVASEFLYQRLVISKILLGSSLVDS
jgi:hypothetical protein